jgi:hypothetical protein
VRALVTLLCYRRLRLGAGRDHRIRPNLPEGPLLFEEGQSSPEIWHIVAARILRLPRIRSGMDGSGWILQLKPAPRPALAEEVWGGRGNSLLFKSFFAFRGESGRDFADIADIPIVMFTLWTIPFIRAIGAAVRRMSLRLLFFNFCYGPFFEGVWPSFRLRTRLELRRARPPIPPLTWRAILYPPQKV